MSYENVPKNLPETVALVREGTPEFTKLDADAFPVPTADPKEVGAVLLVTDTGDQYKWTGSAWVQFVTAAAKDVYPRAEYYLEMAAGRILGKQAIHLFGRNPSVPNSSVFEDIWDAGGQYTGFNATVAETISIVSDDVNDTLAGTGARVVRIEGLGPGFVEQVEFINLNGTTPVTSVLTYLRCADCAVAEAGSGAQNAGTIIGNQSTTTANVFFRMDPTNNGVLAAIYTVPAGKIAYITNGFATIAKKGNASSEIKAFVRFPGTVFQIVEWFAINSTGNSYVTRDFEIPLIPIPAGTDVKIAANADAPNVAIAAGLEIIEEST